MVRMVYHVNIRLSAWRDRAVVCLRSCAGATAIEYAIIAASVAVAIILALNFLGVSISDVFEQIAAVFERQCVQVGSNCENTK